MIEEGLQKEGKTRWRVVGLLSKVVGNSADKEGDYVRGLVALLQSLRGSLLMI